MEHSWNACAQKKVFHKNWIWEYVLSLKPWDMKKKENYPMWSSKRGWYSDLILWNELWCLLLLYNRSQKWLSKLNKRTQSWLGNRIYSTESPLSKRRKVRVQLFWISFWFAEHALVSIQNLLECAWCWMSNRVLKDSYIYSEASYSPYSCID